MVEINPCDISSLDYGAHSILEAVKEFWVKSVSPLIAAMYSSIPADDLVIFERISTRYFKWIVFLSLRLSLFIIVEF